MLRDDAEPVLVDALPLPGGLVTLPPGSSSVRDADEEVFLLYTRRFQNKDDDGIQGLGSVDSRANTLTLNFTLRPFDQTGVPASVDRGRRTKRRESQGTHEKVIEVQVFQDVASLRSRRGDTGSVVWRASVHLARLLLQQYFFPPHSPGTALFDPVIFSRGHILELGSGTGVLGCALPPLLSTGHITLTDLPELVPLLRKNARSDKVSAEALDWTWPILPKSNADLVLCVDCIYNTALVRPLVRVLGTFDAPIFVLVELRDEDVIRAFLEEWLNWGSPLACDQRFQVWRLPDGLFDPRFVAWIGWKS